MKINMGCGWRDFGSDWTHIDGGDYPHLAYNDIQNLEQFEDNTVDLIYASHVIEYFDREEVVAVLSEWKRILKSGGVLRLAVPNFEIIAKLYCNGDYPLKNFLGPLYGKMEMSGKKIFHKTAYDLISLRELLISIDFTNVKEYNWRETEHHMQDDHSQAYLPHMNKESGTLISLNIECIK